MEAHRIVRSGGYHVSQKIGSQIVVRLSALGAGRPLPPGRFLVLISFVGSVNPRATMRLEGLHKCFDKFGCKINLTWKQEQSEVLKSNIDS
jgi:hypothetical protein